MTKLLKFLDWLVPQETLALFWFMSFFSAAGIGLIWAAIAFEIWFVIGSGMLILFCSGMMGRDWVADRAQALRRRQYPRIAGAVSQTRKTTDNVSRFQPLTHLGETEDSMHWFGDYCNLMDCTPPRKGD